jgi:hypothetical protein
MNGTRFQVFRDWRVRVSLIFGIDGFFEVLFRDWWERTMAIFGIGGSFLLIFRDGWSPFLNGI